jgi:phosphatidylglycerophosphate synthase
MKGKLPSRKLPRHLENPFDNFILDIVSFIQPVFRKLNFTPNMITTISLSLGLLSSYTILHKNFKLASILLIFSYIFDCLDGNYARTYNLCSIFGDYYDHLSDNLKIILIIVSLYMAKNFSNFKFYIYIFFLTFLTILAGVHLNYQQLYYNNKYNIKNISQTLDMLSKYLCVANKNNVDEYLKITKYFGCGTLYITLFFFIYFFDKL